MIYEIRNYHYDPTKFEAYKEWAITKAIPFLKENLDVVGFWMDSGDAPEFSGSTPMDLPLGYANVTWIIRLDSMQARTEGRVRVFQGDGWRKIWASHPDANGYFQMEVRFAEGF